MSRGIFEIVRPEEPLAIRVANLRACLAAIAPERPAWLLVRLETLERALLSRQADFEALSLRERYPALSKWSGEILERARQRSPLEVAAAYEFGVIEANEVGEYDVAAGIRRLIERTLTEQVR